MNILIDIDDYDREWIANGYHIPDEINRKIAEAIIEGTPLPDHHGRLIDVSKIDEDKMEQDNPIICITMNEEYIEAVSLDYINNLPTIIEANEGGNQMQVVINISKKKYNEIKERHIITYGDSFVRDLIRRIKNGTPLPEHHGRLIDADALINSLGASDRDIYCTAVIEEDAPTIIEGSDSE